MDSSKNSPGLSASLAGACYPSDPQAILDYFRGFFDRDKAPPWPENKKPANSKFLGVLAPHIDFRISQVAYSHAYAAWFEAEPADTYLILGVGHHARQEWSWDDRDYTTPLGRIEIDREGLDHLRENVVLAIDSQAHVKEHSIEFPLICLQAWRQLRGIDKPFRFLPILCGGLNSWVEAGQMPAEESELNKLAAALRGWIDQAPSRVQVIVSIDGCHVGPRFGHPFAVDDEILAHCRSWEEDLWKQVEQGDRHGFFSHLGENGNLLFFDGVGALALLMHMFGDRLGLRRTHYEQWFERRDLSVVTFTSGYFELRD